MAELAGSWWRRRSDGPWVIGFALILASAIGVARVLDSNPADAPGVLLIVPVALCAVRFGVRGGVISATFGLALATVVSFFTDGALTWFGYCTRAGALILVGVVVGRFVDRGRELEGELAPHRNLSLDLIATADFDGLFTSVNGAWRETLGYTREELVARPMIDLVHPDDRAAALAERSKQLRGEDSLNFQNRFRHKDGSYRWLEWMIRPDESSRSLYAIARDITARKQAENALQLLMEQLAIIQRAIAERLRLDEILETIVHAAARVLDSEIVGLRLIDENDPSYVVLAASTGVDDTIARALRRGPVSEGIGGRAIIEERLLITNDYGEGPSEIPVLAERGVRAAMAAPVYGHGAVVGSLVVATRSDRRFNDADAGTLAFFSEYTGVALSTARAADAVRQALTDPLTGLPNRSLFIDRLEHALARAERAGEEVSVLFLDVDEFKLVNDSLGHLAGDRLLVEMGKRIRKCLRRSDTAARLGGDEFAILVANDSDQPPPELLGARIMEALSAPFRIDGHELRVRASIGIATGCDTPESLLRDADIAMYRAKTSKRSSVCVFEPEMQADTVRDLERRNDLLRAVACKEITVVYQPIVSLASGRIEALEALARWTHPEQGPISPDVFIPLAENAGVIQEIGSTVLHEACAQLGRWRAEQHARADLQISVNISPDQLGQALVTDIEQALAVNALPPTALILELTETNLLHDSETALGLLAELRGRGIQIAIDDFGTGYSSLRYLRRFPVDILKIAKPFIDGIEHSDGRELAFARLITDLAGTLGLVTVAEGIESAGQHSRLRQLGCSYGQGYLYSRPVAASEVGALLDAEPPARDLPLAA
jgi:diguanylate cyclase (GGDEF)-like protein/PAS domain S-box-containing protein